MLKKLTSLLILCSVGYSTLAQQPVVNDTTSPKQVKKDSIKPHSPKLALKRSAMIPGWGQIYNKQAWKVPIIYGVLGFTGYVFFNNLKTYNDIRFAFNAKTLNDLIAIAQIDPKLKNLSTGDLSFYRRRFRQNIDYSVLYFVVFWGLNVADAVVFAHLKNFDVSDNISANLKIGNSSIAKTTGLSLSFDLHKKKQKALVVVK
jgi:Family of unknown function (DUF5683)